MDNIYKLIDFCLKKKDIDISEINIKNYYLFNRWLSMTDNNICIIINSLANRWLLKNNNINILNFYRIFLPKNNKKFQYIKKKNKEQKNVDVYKLANNLELSTREVEQYEEMIDFLGKKNN
jgi:hypothetical protein